VLAIPAGMLLCFAAVVALPYVFYALFALLPLSMEMELPGGFGTDFPSELLMVFLMFCAVFYFAANPKKLERDFFDNGLTKMVILHLIWIGIVSVFSLMFSISIKFFLAKCWYIIVFFVMTGMFIRNTDDFKNVIWFLALPLLFVTLWTLGRHAGTGFDFENVNKSMKPFFRNHVNYGVMLAFWIPFLWVGYNKYKAGTMARMILQGILLVALVGIFFSYTRAAWVSVAILPFGYIMFKSKLTRPAVTVAVLVAGMALSFVLTGDNYKKFEPNYERTVYHKNLEDHLTATLAGEDLSVMERVYRWVAGIRMANEYKLTGFGPGTFTRFYRGYTVSSFETYVSTNEDESTIHNYFLLVLVEQGWIGFFIFMILCIYAFIRGEVVYHETRDPHEKRFVMAALLILLMIMANLVQADLLETDEIGSIFFLCLAVIAARDIVNKQNNDHENEDDKHLDNRNIHLSIDGKRDGSREE